MEYPKWIYPVEGEPYIVESEAEEDARAQRIERKTIRLSKNGKGE